MALSFQLLKVTPDIARKWLESNPANRPIRQGWVENLCGRMRRGEWRLAEPLMFDQEGNLLDGQHRLLALVRSGTAQEMVVLGNYPRDETWGVLGQQIVRTAGDVLGIEHGRQIASIARLEWNARRQEGDPWNRRGTRKEYPSIVQIQQLIDEIPWMAESARLWNGLIKTRLMIAQSVGGWCHMRTALISGEDAQVFSEALNGGGMAKEDPIFLLRELLLQGTTASGIRRKLPERACAALYFKTWNLKRTRRNVAILRWTAKSEAFPTPE